MVIGPTGCGKTSLVNALNDEGGPLRRTQTIIYGNRTMDVPGSYIENAGMYKHIIASAQQASHVLILVDPSKCSEVYSPGFAKAFKKPVIGVITKCVVPSCQGLFNFNSTCPAAFTFIRSLANAGRVT